MDLKFRRIIVSTVFVLVALIFIGRLFYIQVIDDTYKLDALNNSRRFMVKHPARGLIYDRNHELIVANEAAYDLMVVYGQVKNLDTIKLLDILQIDKHVFLKEMQKAADNKYRPYPVVKQISVQTASRLQETLHNFPGFFTQVRTVRSYPHKCGALVLGYISEVTKEDIADDEYYEQGDYIGKIGIERVYERYLRGQKGGAYLVVDVKGRVKGSLEDGKHDRPSVLGKDVVTTLDIYLQEYGEKLMQNKTGSIVAIEPKTGEVLALISSPAFDPNLMVGQSINVNYRKFVTDPNKPLYNRALQGDRYPPGSTFKIVNALVALQEEIITPSFSVGCQMGYFAGGIKVGCHAHPSPLNLVQSIQMSCNAYYCNIFRAILDANKYKTVQNGYDVWRNHVLSMGLGAPLGIDLPSERPGNIPKPEYYDKYYGKNRWKSLTIVSLSIGQGEICMTPLQMANCASIIANRGYYYTPHVVREIQDTAMDNTFKKKHVTSFDQRHFHYIIEGMYDVVQGGGGSTARVAAIPGINIGGKTGTAQNPHGKDHSIFMAFAPIEDPKIAIAVYVENSGFGATYAAPIASLMIEQYLTDTIKRPWLETRMLEANLIHKPTPTKP
ncbi:MAG: penicillin-binding protein 2 [Bacteroidetes bacterium]|nr:penicillin-binding protein 2 [Bacteroidota bacterium]